MWAGLNGLAALIGQTETRPIMSLAGPDRAVGGVSVNLVLFSVFSFRAESMSS